VAGNNSRSHASEFAARYSAAPSHYMANHDSYSMLLTGTVVVLGNNQNLVLSAQDDVVILGNIHVSGTQSDLTVHSEKFVFIEGELSVTDSLTISGGTDNNGDSLDGADSRGSSVYLSATGRITTPAAGSSISITGAQD
ncbi:MAG: hypothetical protein ACK6EB_46955, partial [Planctomyces sp.]